MSFDRERGGGSGVGPDMRVKPIHAAAVIPAAMLSGCQLTLFDPKGTVADQDMQILVDSVAIMLAIVLPTIVAIVAFAWWFRAGNGRAKHLPNFEYSGRIELVVWSIPALTVMLLSGVIWIGSHKLDPAAEIDGQYKPLEIEAVSLDWKWLFLYPDQKIATVNQLVAPVGVPLHIRLTSASVMTAFFVPQWGSMIYTMNGMTSRLNLRVDQAGVTRGEATQIAGDGFSDMHFEARGVSPEEFATWAKGVAGAPFDAAAYHELEKQGLAKPEARPLADPHLFDDIVSQKIPPAPGPSPAPHPKPLGDQSAR
jgi:cytochrome o ubiquinol oxidase subunit 2